MSEIDRGAFGPMSRRGFIKASTIAVGAALGGCSAAAWSNRQNSFLAKFIQPLRDVTAGGIPLAAKDPGWTGVDHYTLTVAEYSDQLHPHQDPTRLWGYGQPGHFQHLGGIIVASRDVPVQVTFRNELPTRHLLPVDTSIMGASEGADRTCPHLHGGFVPWPSDGGPHAWWNAAGTAHGPSYERDFMLSLNPNLGANEGEFYYPNQQGARLVWYHDHTIGMTRLNAYAGVASAYVLTDAYETVLAAAPVNLPGPLDPRTKYLVFQDKKFVSPRFLADNPNWTGSRRVGDLGYADFYDPHAWDLAGGPPPRPSVIPEFFGDTMLVNGAVAPYLQVEPRLYRLRVLNACNARFLNPAVYYASGAAAPASTEADLARPGPAFVQIGTEAGFLPAPAVVTGSATATTPLLLAPGERADLLLDLRDVAPGTILIVHSDADAPYPMGDPATRYDGSLMRGFTPDTSNLLQLRVVAPQGAADADLSLPAVLTPTDPWLVEQSPGQPTPVPDSVTVGGVDLPVSVKRKTLNEGFDGYGRLAQRMGTDVPVVAATAAADADFGRAYDDAPTEVVAAGSVEVWELINLTADTHPMHFHLTNVQILSRQVFDAAAYAASGGGAPTYQGDAIAPDLNELGWKETVRCPPGYVTRVILRFELPSLPFAIPPSARVLDMNGIANGHEYVWHCHILEHEEHDMMRPLIVTSA